MVTQMPTYIHVDILAACKKLIAEKCELPSRVPWFRAFWVARLDDESVVPFGIIVGDDGVSYKIGEKR